MTISVSGIMFSGDVLSRFDHFHCKHGVTMKSVSLVLKIWQNEQPTLDGVVLRHIVILCLQLKHI